MALCGALAGLAGGLLVAGLYHRLIPSISGLYGYTAILAVLMVSGRLPLLPLACLFFAALTVGSIQLPLELGLDSSLSGVIQGVLVLTVFAARRFWPADSGRKAWSARRPTDRPRDGGRVRADRPKARGSARASLPAS